VADIPLKEKSVVGGYRNNFGDVTLVEVTGKALVSIAIANRKVLSGSLKKTFKADLPAVGLSTKSDNGTTVFWGMQVDQLFVLFDRNGDDGLRYIEQKLGNAGYYTDQSDSWVIINISGTGARAALERICMIDLHFSSFPAGSVVRTVMEHLGTIIYFQGDDSFLVLTARSFAKSLLHALETSIQNTAP